MCKLTSHYPNISQYYFHITAHPPVTNLESFSVSLWRQCRELSPANLLRWRQAELSSADERERSCE